MSMGTDPRLQWTAILAAALSVAMPAFAQQNTARPAAPLRVQRMVTAIQSHGPSASIQPPATVVAVPPSSAVILRPGSNLAVVKSLQVRREYAIPTLRAQPVVALGRGHVNLAPLLANPRAPFNIAQHLRTQPQLADVTVDETQVLEIDQGLVVRSLIGYRLHTGVCTDPARSAKLASSGVHCFGRLDDSARAAAFANPADAHYVADPQRRAIAIQRAEQKAAAVRAKVTQDIASLRVALADPTKRAAIDAKIGASESARLAKLDDAQLEQEVVNAGETRVEQVMFVPASGRADPTRFAKVADFGSALSKAGSSTPSPHAQLVDKAAPVVEIVKPEPTDATVEPHVFLTGFTLGRAYEWRQRVETTISWCLFGCDETYFAELYAGFDYGFGLRFPVVVGGQYHYPGSGTTATFTPDVRSLDGNAGDYASAGLESGKLFDGKELVAQFGAYAGANYDVPFAGSGGVEFKVGKDFTDGLPAPFTHGQFRPPMPGQDLAGDPIVFDDFDLIGGRANFGVAGGQVFPAVKVSLHSDSLRLKLHDNNGPGGDVPMDTATGPIKLHVDPKTMSSDFTVGSPVYNLGFLLTPGLDARLFIDIEVWSDHWDWPIWFPELAVELPPGGVDFACHDGTVCSRHYHYAASEASQNAWAEIFGAKLEGWGKDFDSRWLQQCTDDICRTGIKLVRTNAVLLGKQKVSTEPGAEFEAMSPAFANAEATANTLVLEGQMRLTQQAGKGWSTLAQAVWSKKCADLPCMDKVASLSSQMTQAAIDRQAAEPDASSLQVQGEVGREYGPKFQAEIDASTARASRHVPVQLPPLMHAARNR
ncbi:hypothetical protein [Cognatilysobacter lacus]|uniref:Uncharacterized protein n=1 Tax=Cognatilysobacter lacus TaxID=1643323 RepID=A0A5D8Z6A2_9GAMM|nr:hypothetical protein [Lysobacter lacus]TZF90237.1 hypothetical protein FW784_06170 [Lysobacter lacus]